MFRNLSLKWKILIVALAGPVIVAAITSRQGKTTLPTHVSISAVELPRDSVVLLEQIRTIDKRRLTGFVGHLDTTSMQQVDEAIVVSFGLQYLEELCHGK